MRFILASTSKARLEVLTAAGIIPEAAYAPEVDERERVEQFETANGRKASAAETVELLARAKAEAVALAHPLPGKYLVFGGDSVFELEGEILGKPHIPEVAYERAKKHRGKTGTLYSGHWIVVCEAGEIVQSQGLIDTATVRLNADITDTELRAYIATGEPLQLAGGFAIDGLSGAFIDEIVGTPSCVMGLSLPALRRLMQLLGYEYISLWSGSTAA